MEKDNIVILHAIAQTIYDKKGMNILALDMRKCSNITDYVIIAEGNVDRHVIAIASAIEKTLSAMGIAPCHEEGFGSGDWVVLDYFQVMVHLFMPGLREKYQLEQLWSRAKIVDLAINVSSEKSTAYSRF